MSDGMGNDDEEGGANKTSGKKLVLFIIVPIFILLAVGAGLFFSGMLDSLLGEEVTEEVAAEEITNLFVPSSYYELDEMLVSLRSAGAKQKFLKIQLSLELEDAGDIAVIEASVPRIIDSFQVFLRELHIEELEGSRGVYLIKEELLSRVNQAIHPVKIKDVLFKDMLIQ